MKRFFKVLSVLTAAIMIVSVMPITALAASFSEAKNSVVYIEAYFSNGDPARRGSGFAIGKVGEKVEHIVTNAHVITSNETRATEVRVYFSYAANDFMRAQVVVCNNKKDVAVLKLPEATDKRKALVICKSKDVNLDNEFATLGYPADSDFFVEDTAKTWDLSDISIKRGGIQKKTTDIDDLSVYNLDGIKLSPGESGGPLINEKNEVVGISTYSVLDSLYYAVAIDELTSAISREEIPYTLSTDVPAAGEEDAAADAGTQPASDNTLIIVIAIAAAVVVIAIVIVIVVVSKGKKKASAAVPQSIPSPAAKISQGAVITGMKGFMANRSFNINGSIVLGRNPQKCTVCYPVDSKGISGVHCQIRQTANGYEIMDLGSSNGTFLGSGERLTPNVPVFIPDGTFFYLGSAEQLFQIKY